MMDYLIFTLGLYLVLECIVVAILMDHGDRLCRFLKYLLAVTSGSYAMLIAWDHCTVWQDLIWTSALALFVWPKMVHRLQAWWRTWQGRHELKSEEWLWR